MTGTARVHYYFVDEAGDLNLFNRRGAVIVGRPGVSRAFMVGVAHLPDPEAAARRLEELRSGLLSDPYFQGVPSMQPDGGKTALCFHAKDDVAEVRREVFRLLPQLGAKVQVAIRRKDTLVSEARMAHRRGSRLSDGDVYDDLIKRLFRNLLHKADENRIVFARRGKAVRRDALADAIDRARKNFERRWGRQPARPTTIESAYPSAAAGLQIVDYYLWALQRLYERGEERFFRILAPDYRLIMDLDDTRNKPYGQWYSDSNPLALEKMKPLVG
jgi:hypothetical protein